MKKLSWISIAVMVTVMLIFSACTSGAPSSAPSSAPAKAPAPSGQPVELKLAHGWATTHHAHVMLDAWTKDVEKATEGRVKITIYPGGALSTPVQLFDTVSTGVADLAWFLQGYTPGKFPLTSVIELPFMATSAEQASQALWEIYEKTPQMQAEYPGVKVLALWTVDTGQLMVAKKVVRNFDEIKGLKLRIGSDSLKPTTESLGAVPILMAVNELYDGLQKGVVDGTLIGTSAIKPFKLQDVLKGVTMVDLFTSAMGLAINSNSWAKISAQDQKIIMDLSGTKLAKAMGANFDSEAKLALDVAKGAGVEIVELPAAEKDKWKKAVAGIHQQWIADMKAKGLPAQEVYDEITKLIKKYE